MRLPPSQGTGRAGAVGVKRAHQQREAVGLVQLPGAGEVAEQPRGDDAARAGSHQVGCFPLALAHAGGPLPFLGRLRSAPSGAAVEKRLNAASGAEIRRSTSGPAAGLRPPLTWRVRSLEPRADARRSSPATRETPMPTLAPTILIAHANRPDREALAAQLDLDGYAVYEAPTAAGAIDALRRMSPRMILLGVLERPAASATLLRDLRGGRLDRADANVPVISMGATHPVAQLRAYEDGSDHHLAGDVDYVILRAVVAAVVRRAAGPLSSPRVIELGSLTIDTAAREVRIGGQIVDLPGREFELLKALAADPRRVFTKAELLKRVWGYEDPRSTRTLDSHACRLRRRLTAHGQPGLVRAQWGVGYRLTS